MSSIQERFVQRTFEIYKSLPKKAKPGYDAAGVRNWVPLSSIGFVDENENIDVVAVATGMKCLPANVISSLQGIALHDSHAEILAIRLFNHVLMRECHRMASADSDMPSSPYESKYIRRTTKEEQASDPDLQPFRVREQLRIWMYCSEAPCGDASMELVMAKQEDATPWAVQEVSTQDSPSLNKNRQTGSELRGRGFFSELGVVRRKPARGDALPTWSKSCTDKLALRQCTSMLSSLTTLLIVPSNVYLNVLLLPLSQHVPVACNRAFGPAGRMKAVAGINLPDGYRYQHFEVVTTEQEFECSKRAPLGTGQGAVLESKPSNVAAAWTAELTEVIIGGVLQGRKKGDPRGASSISCRNMHKLLENTVNTLKAPRCVKALASAGTYRQLKLWRGLEAYRATKDLVTALALKGWSANKTDDFTLRPQAQCKGTA